MKERKLAEAAVQLLMLTLAWYMDDPQAKAKTYRGVARAAAWGALQLGRIRIAAEARYYREVSP